MPLKPDYQKIYFEAEQAGKQAYVLCQPQPMVVARHSNPLDDSSEVEKAWHVPDGVCGFAHVIVTPGTCSFARWLVKCNLGHKSYYGGVSVRLSYKGQSYERNCAYANAFSDVLSKYGIESHVDSRLD